MMAPAWVSGAAYIAKIFPLATRKVGVPHASFS